MPSPKPTPGVARQPAEPSQLPLSGITVVDFTRVLAGPMATMVLGDLGAEVIKIERPGRGDDTRDWGIQIGETETTYYYAFNRNKRSVALDLSVSSDRDLARDLIADADIVVQNFRPGVMEKLGFGYETLSALNPRIVYCAIAGYDAACADRDRPGYDLVAQAESGLMALNGEESGPPLKLGIAAVDMFAGMYAAQAVLAALYRAQKTGNGQRIDLALYDCGVMLTAYYGLDALMTGTEPSRYGNAHPSVVPYGVFQAADGPVILAVGNTKQFRILCQRALGRPDLAEDPRYQTNLLRMKHRDVLLAELRHEFLRHGRRAILATLAEAEVPCAEVMGLHAALTHERTRASGLIHEHRHASGRTAHVMVPPWRFDGARFPVTPPPLLGEHTSAYRKKTG